METKVQTVNTDADVYVQASAPVTHLCPFKDEVDKGVINVGWRCNGKTFELHDLAKYLDSFASVTTSHEDLIATVLYHLSGYDGIAEISAAFITSTAGLDVQIRERKPQ